MFSIKSWHNCVFNCSTVTTNRIKQHRYEFSIGFVFAFYLQAPKWITTALSSVWQALRDSKGATVEVKVWEQCHKHDLKLCQSFHSPKACYFPTFYWSAFALLRRSRSRFSPVHIPSHPLPFLFNTSFDFFSSFPSILSSLRTGVGVTSVTDDCYMTPTLRLSIDTKNMQVCGIKCSLIMHTTCEGRFPIFI